MCRECRTGEPQLTVAVDYDGTYGADKETFRDVVTAFIKAGHTVVLVTQRAAPQGEEIVREVGHLLPIVWSYGMEKLYAAAAEGFDVDIWIEDNPAAVYTPLRFVGDAR